MKEPGCDVGVGGVKETSKLLMYVDIHRAVYRGGEEDCQRILTALVGFVCGVSLIVFV